jgi:predicted ribonuclease YlaK
MQEHHFFPDTCFLIDYPDFHLRFLFGDGPCTIVICDPVLDQLDRLKKNPSNSLNASQASTDRSDDSKRAFHAREAIRTINGIWEKRIEIPENLCLVHYKGHARRVHSVDREILQLAERYARQNKSGRTILLTPDINFRSMAHGSIVQPVDPIEWHNARRYERLLRIGVVLDDAVRMAHETHVSLEAQLNEAETAQDNRKLKQIQEQLRAAREKMRAEVQRFETERKYFTEKILLVWQQDSAVRETHQRRTLLEDEVYSLAALGLE